MSFVTKDVCNNFWDYFEMVTIDYYAKDGGMSILKNEFCLRNWTACDCS